MIYLISAVIALLTALPAFAADECRSATTHEGLASAPYVQFSSKDPDQRFANIPTIAPISGTKLFAGDFVSILLLDLDKAEIGVVEIKGGAPQIQPSALFYSPATKLLFSADYLLDKVSVFWFDGTALTFLFDIGGMLSPEGLAFDTEASILSVAEFDGHTASAWHVNVDERSAQMIWRRPVQYAHGVTTAAGKVYVTSLYDRKIHVFDQATGAEQEGFGSQGWDAAAMQFLWPTTITSDGAGKLLVADAETGYVSVIDPETRKVTAVIGGAGPGRGMFSQPYGAAIADGRLTIISTKDERFVSIEYPSLCVIASYVRDATDWAWYEPSVGPFKADPGDYLWSAGPRLPLFGHSYIVYSAAFVNIDAATTVTFGNTTGPLGYVQYKQIQYVKNGPFEYLFSPYAYNGPTLIRRELGRLFTLNFPADLHRDRTIKDCWADWGNIACSEKEGYDLAGMQAILDSWAKDVNSSRCGNGVVLQLHLAEATSRAAVKASMRAADLTSVFSSAQGREFLKAYETIQSCESDTSELTRLGKDILTAPDRASLYELSLISVVLPDNALERNRADGPAL